MRNGRSLAMALLAASLPCGGCGLTPHAFRKLQPAPANVRARSIGQESGENARVVPALVDRLEDEDPVVRMAAQEELRQRTGRDFGFVAWAGPEERAAAVARWRGWLNSAAAAVRAPAVPLAADAPRAARRPARRRRNRAQTPAATTAPAPPTPENVSS